MAGTPSSLSSLFTTLWTATLVLAFGLVAQGQSDSTNTSDMWWKGLFRAPISQETNPMLADSSAGTSSMLMDTHKVNLTRLPAQIVWGIPAEIASLDSAAKADPKPLQGFRIQIYFGELQEARSTRAAFRRNHPDIPVQLLPIAPNYAVTVGNYRDLWSARKALQDQEVGSWPNALVIPSPIDLPPLN